MRTASEDEVRIAMAHLILDSGLSPMEALATALTDSGEDVRSTADIMTRMSGREISPEVVASYISKARRKKGLPDRRKRSEEI